MSHRKILNIVGMLVGIALMFISALMKEFSKFLLGIGIFYFQLLLYFDKI